MRVYQFRHLGNFAIVNPCDLLVKSMKEATAEKFTDFIGNLQFVNQT